MTQEDPTLRTVYKLLVHYFEYERSHMTINIQDATKELKSRLRRLESDYNRLIKINSELLSLASPKYNYKEESDRLVISIENCDQVITIKKKPDKIGVNSTFPPRKIASTYAYVSGSDSKCFPETNDIKIEMEGCLESYYLNAFRITKLSGKILDKRKYQCKEITTVRNKLIIHPDNPREFTDKITIDIYSFGASMYGPVIKPIRREQKAWNDKGLIYNNKALVSSLIDAFS